MSAIVPPRRPSRAESFWLWLLFACAARHPWILWLMRPIVKAGVPLVAPHVRRAVQQNGRRLLGPDANLKAANTVAAFYDFIIDLTAAREATPESLRRRIASVSGREEYVALRERGGGVVIVTAHMGSFEVGLSGLTEVEEEIHVVFKRDANDHFEDLRQSVRRVLGVHEAAIDDGWPTLVKLRDRLEAGAAVVMQADRAMPGQKSQIVPFGHGQLRLPLGPLRLAQMTGSPIVPVFTIRQPDGRFRVLLEPPIDPQADDAMEQLASVLARVIAAHAEQWLVLEPAFVEDAVT